MEVETVDDDNDSGSDSEDDISDDDSSDNEIENKGVSNKHPSKEGVSETDKQESKEQQGHFNMRGTREMCRNLRPPRASHRSGLRQPRHVNYTHATVNHVKNNSKTRTTSDSHINRNSKRQSTPKPKYEYFDDNNVAINSKNRSTCSKKKTRKHKSREQENPYYDHNSSHDKKVKPFLDARASFNKEINEITYFINHVVLTQYGMQKGLQVFDDRGLTAIKKEIQQFHDLDVISPINVNTMTKQQKSQALSYLMFLKEKRDGNSKGRGCADGRKQRM